MIFLPTTIIPSPPTATPPKIIPGPRPGSELYKKLHNDPRGKKFIEKNGRLVQFEVEALFGFAPDEFTRMVIEAVDKYFDQDIYQQQVLNEEMHSVESLTELLREKVQDIKIDSKF